LLVSGSFVKSAARLLAVATALVFFTGCRSMPAAPRPIEQTRTFQSATIDPEPHVFSFTVHAPTFALDFSSPRSLGRSMLPGEAGEFLNSKFEKRTGRTRGIQIVGHCMIELKSVDSKTGQVRYLLTSVTNADRNEIADRFFKDQAGYEIAFSGIKGKIPTAEDVGQDLDEAAEIGIKAARARIVISEATANRMFDFFEEFQRRRIFEKFIVASSPLDERGICCSSLVASFLEAGGLLEPEWKEDWQRRLLVPSSLIGDPNTGTKVPPMRLLIGPQTRRWAKENEPNQPLAFYDTTKMYDWILSRHQTPSEQLPPGYTAHGIVEKQIEAHMAMPVVTIDMRNRPVPTGPIYPVR
jgi:hypothetical protein